MALVDRVDAKIRFRHSVIQAYLGAQRLPAVLADDFDGYLDVALRDPGRELLIALAICCHGSDGAALRGAVRDRLEREARRRRGAQAFDLLAAAYQIDAMTGGEGGRALRETTARLWGTAASGDPTGDVKTDQAKLRAISRMRKGGGRAAQAALWHVCLHEDSYRVRLAAAQAMAYGGVDAHAQLEAAKAAPKVSNYDLRVLQRELEVRDGQCGATRRAVRCGSLQGWILPTLVDTCSPPEDELDSERDEKLRGELESWICQAEKGLHLGVESCFAQGFKHAANRLPHRTRPEVRAYLTNMAERLLRASNWWYTQLTVLQALALWCLEIDQRRRLELTRLIWEFAGSDRHPFVRRTARLCKEAVKAPLVGAPAAKKGPAHYIWIDETGVVTRIGSRAAIPDPFSDSGLWIPPAVGWHTLAWPARALVADILVYLNLIEGGDAATTAGLPPTLDPKTARSRARDERRQRVADAGLRLPDCLAHGPERKRLLRPAEDLDGDSPPCGKECCPFRLCPYPDRSERPFRGELSEMFCRDQKRILRARRRRLRRREYAALLPVPSKHTPAGRLTKFWTTMEKRVARIGG
jgi:hypothetical protein